MLKKESERVIKIPKGEYTAQEDDRPNKSPVISEAETLRHIEAIEKRKAPIRKLAKLLISQDPSYKASGERLDGYTHAFRI